MDLRVALDTNRLIDLFKGDSDLATWLGLRDEIWIPLPVLAEFKVGFLLGSRGEKNEAVFRAFLSQPTVEIQMPTRRTADEYARLFAQLRKAGTPIPINHVWIAALALENDLTLVTRDAHFERIPQLRSITGC